MLLELTIHDFAIIERIHLRLEPGFGVMTGETGAGKSIIVDAMTLLLGGRAQSDLIRSGAERARVEGVFALDGVRAARLRPLLESNGLVEEGDEDTLILSREINRTGRHLCRINGRAVPLSLLREAAAPLVDIHGQSEHLSLMNPRRHVDLLDRFAGTLPQRETLAEEVRGFRTLQAEIDRLAQPDETRAYRIDRLTFVVQEIDEADLAADELETLNRERRLLVNGEKRSQLAGEIVALLSEGLGDEAPPVESQLALAVRALAALTRLDDSLADTLGVGEEALALVADLGRTMGLYLEEIEYDPGRLEEIEQRLTRIFNLKQKYGETIPEILQTRDAAAAELAEIEQREARLEILQKEREERLARIAALGVDLSKRRRRAAARMEKSIKQELADLRMEQADFRVQFEWEEEAGGAPVAEPPGREAGGRFRFDLTGLDRIEFLLAPNPGEGLKPMARIASGGESARIMLAIKSALGRADDTPTLIFDEIDTGVGGRLGQTVGAKLYGLAAQRQVLSITHLPQIAAFGDQHFLIEKEVTGGRTKTHVRVMDEEGRVGELALMIGGGEAAWQTAADLREQARKMDLNELRLS